MPSTRSFSRALAIAALVVWGAAADVLAQSCAMCSASFAPDDPVQRAFSWSILFLMAAPYSIVAAVGGWLFFVHRRASGRHRAAVLDLTRARRPAPAGVPGGTP